MTGAMPNTVITLRLGFLEAVSENAKLKSEPILNTSRWVFDVAHSVEATSQLELLLKLPYLSSYPPKVVSYALAPLSESFWDASVYIVESAETPLKITLCAQKDCLYRVAIDTIVR